MPRNTRASKRKNDDNESNTPLKTVKKTSATPPPSTSKSRQSVSKSSPASKLKSGSNKRKIDQDSGEEGSSPSASPKNKRRDLRSFKTPPSNNVESKKTEKQNTPSAVPAITTSTSSIRRSKRQSTILNVSVTEMPTVITEEKELASPPPKKTKESMTPKSTKTTPKTARKTTSKKNTPESSNKVAKVDSPKIVKSPTPSQVTRTFKVVEKPPLPKQLSREEVYEKYLETLQEKLNKFDLSVNRTGEEDFFKDWPDSEVLDNIKKNPLLNRTWYSNDKRAEDVKSSKLEEFNIASYDINEITTSSHNQSINLIKEEINYIDADLFCIQNVSSECEKSLISCLSDKKYKFSQADNGCIIGYKDTKFDVIETKTIMPHDILLNFIKKSSYPSDWKDSLEKNIQEPSSLNKSPLVIYVLKHIGTGSILLLSSQSQYKKSKDIALRPDLNALNVTSIMWSVCQVWNEINEKLQKKIKTKTEKNGNSNKDQKLCWLFCGSLNACYDSPIYQLIRDGYPCDETINRLRCIRPVEISLTNSHKIKRNAKDEASVSKKALIDLLWHAFQHPQSDVTSCYADVVGREPPFTQIDERKQDDKSLKCDHYIWCSKSTLRPKSVLLTPCRALMSGTKEPNLESYTIPLAAKIEILP